MGRAAADVPTVIIRRVWIVGNNNNKYNNCYPVASDTGAGWQWELEAESNIMAYSSVFAIVCVVVLRHYYAQACLDGPSVLQR